MALIDKLVAKPIIQAFGGGRQSTAILILIAQEKLPRPDHIVMANTSREATSTWDYMERYSLPLMQSLGLDFHLAPHSLARRDMYNDKGKPAIPAFTRAGKLRMSVCSGEWKRDVMQRYLKKMGYGPKRHVTVWIGYSLDEITRVKPSLRKWCEHAFPLVGLNMPSDYRHLRLRAGECRRIVQEFGWPDPPRSSCWMCPHRTNEEWVFLKENYPLDWEKAVKLEREMNEHDLRSEGLFLHRQRVPLNTVDFSELDANNELDLPGLESCASGYCFV